MLAPGTTLRGSYTIVRLIAQGGMGAVYLAKHQRLGSTVAVKETFFDDTSMLKAFEREARLLASLRHGALPKVIDHFSEADGWFLVMEFIGGDDFAEMLKQRGGAFPVNQVIDWADQLLRALEYLHKQTPPVIHRDIKPHNLKLTEEGQIVLLDFGLAKGHAEGMSRMTAGHSIQGYTPAYAPLEQIQGAGTDARSDLYSLAATLYHLMTGFTPADALSRAAVVVTGQPDPLRPANELNPQLPQRVADVLTKAMSQNRDQRPISASEMRRMLRDAMGHERTRRLLWLNMERGHQEKVDLMIAITLLKDDIYGKQRMLLSKENDEKSNQLKTDIKSHKREIQRMWQKVTDLEDNRIPAMERKLKLWMQKEPKQRS